MSKITVIALRKIIFEEIKNLKEGINEDSAASLAFDASKLLKALESFKESATVKSKADLGNHLDEVEKILKRIITSPMQYIDVTKSVVKKVSLKSSEKPVIKTPENVM